MHISHGHSQNWNSVICELAKWISSKQVIGVCHQSLTASNRIPSRKSIKTPPLYGSIFQQQRGGGRRLLLYFRIVAWKPKPWLYFLVQLNSWWRWPERDTRKAPGQGCLLTDWTCKLWKCEAEMSEALFADHHFLILVNKICSLEARSSESDSGKVKSGSLEGRCSESNFFPLLSHTPKKKRDAVGWGQQK